MRDMQTWKHASDGGTCPWSLSAGEESSVEDRLISLEEKLAEELQV
jgi:hypothetical protein